MPEEHRDLEARVTGLERDIDRLREEVTLARSDSAASRVLASGADRDVSEVRAELRAHTRALGALRQTQLEHSTEMRRRFAAVDERFAVVDANFARVDANFARVDANFAQVDANFAAVEEKLAIVNAGIVQIIGLVGGGGSE